MSHMDTQDSGYQEVPSTPYLYQSRFKASVFEVPSSPVSSRRPTFLTRSQASSGFSREQDVPCTPAASSSSPSSISTTTSLTVPSQAEQTVPRTPRAQRIQNMKMLKMHEHDDRIRSVDASSSPGIKRSLEQKRRIEAITSSGMDKVKYLFDEEDIFD